MFDEVQDGNEDGRGEESDCRPSSQPSAAAQEEARGIWVSI